MKKIFTNIFLAFCFVFLLTNLAIGQASDFMVLKKGGRTQRSYYEGVHIAFSTASGFFEGQIEKISKDSVYLLQYDIRHILTRFGIYMLDTVAVYRLKFNFRDIIAIDKQKKGFSKSATGASLLGTGTLLTVLGAGSWLVTEKNSRYYARPGFVAACAGLAGLGYLILKTSGNGIKIGKKYTLEYIHVR